MPRRSYKKNILKDDAIYSSGEIAKLISYVMRDGKRTVAQKQVYAALENLKTAGNDPVTTIHKVIEILAPLQEVRPRRIGGASYLVPTETRPARKTFLALNWLVECALSRSNKEYHTFAQKLSAEVKAVLAGEGEALKKRAAVEKLAEANKAFAHFKW